MESCKSPGTDGLPAEFWIDISTFLIDALNMSFSKGYPPISQRWGLITPTATKEKQTSAIFEKLETYHHVKL